MAGANRRPWSCASRTSPRRKQPKRHFAQIALLSQPSDKLHTTCNCYKAFFNGPPAPMFIGNA
jgi:hypothetical protein